MTGRENELQLFEDIMKDERSHFVAVYGRRRIGKTFLIREAFNYRFTFQHAGLSKGTLSEQLFAFEASVKDAGLAVSSHAKNWLEAFELLKDVIRNSTEKKKVIFIDELSWMDTRNSRLIVALEQFWNGWASARKDILLIVCTSATSWMLSNVVHNKGGLYNRLTEQIALEPFTLRECEDYVQSVGIAFSRKQILEYYMVFGGVPYYWTFLKKGLGLTQNIDQALFSANAPLKQEFDYLYASIFHNPEPYLRIIRVLAEKKAGMTREEIVRTAKINNSGDLTSRLDELESCGFIRSFFCFGKKKKDTLYQLVDFFTLFYYRFMKKKPTDEHFWTNQLNTPAVNTWNGLAFERVCLMHIKNIKKKLGISGVHTDNCSWYCKPDSEKGIAGAQIDLMIVRADRIINLCEIKYAKAEYTMNERVDTEIRRKIDSLVKSTRTKNAIFPTLITTYGVVDNAYAGNLQSVITMEDLF